MRLLLDTHAFMWWDSEPGRLSPRVLAMCQGPANSLVLSVVSACEISIKVQLGKLALASPLADVITGQQRLNQLEVLTHVLALDSLPAHHKDHLTACLSRKRLW